MRAHAYQPFQRLAAPSTVSGPRPSDSAPMAYIAWVDIAVVEETRAEPEAKKSSTKATKTKAAPAAEAAEEKPKRAAAAKKEE